MTAVQKRIPQWNLTTHPFLSGKSAQREILLGEIAGGDVQSIGGVGGDESPEEEKGQQGQDKNNGKFRPFFDYCLFGHLFVIT